MPIHYPQGSIKKVLKSLGIVPNAQGHISGPEVVAILTWRAQSEYKREHRYHPNCVRRLVEEGKLPVAFSTGPRRRWYRPQDAFVVPITPSRGTRREELFCDPLEEKP